MERNTIVLAAICAQAFWPLFATQERGPARDKLRDEKTPYGILRMVDRDRDGTVSYAEWGDFLDALEADEDGVIPHVHFHRYLEENHPRHRPAGENGSDNGTLREGPPHNRRRPPSAFPLDRDGDGFFEIDDLNAIFAVLDTDGDGSLQPGEIPSPPRRRRPPRQP